MSTKLYLYPFWLRAWHWINALLFFALIWTGASMHFAGSSFLLIPFQRAVAVHNICGVTLTAAYLLFAVANIASGNFKHYVPRLRGLGQRLFLQTKYYLFGIFKGEPHPSHAAQDNKFNALQQLTYVQIMYGLMPLLLGTGWLLFFPEYSPERIFGAGGVWPVAVLHTVLGFLGALFMLGHAYLGTTGTTPGANFKGMWTGWHYTDDH
jgi:thiosulfate reductase cytochrome b subunit